MSLHQRSSTTWVVGSLIVLMTACSDAGNLDQPQLRSGSRENQLFAANDSDYTTTPFGRFHKSCVVEIPQGSRLEHGGVVRNIEGRTAAKTTIPQCRYEHAPPPRSLARRSGLNSPTTGGWVEDAEITYGGSLGFSAIYADIIVPPAPSGYLPGLSQTYYTFPGVMPADGSTILQPVLQYGTSPAGGGAYWSMATWACPWEATGTCVHSTLKKVYPGDSLTTYVHSQRDETGSIYWGVGMDDNTYPHWVNTANVYLSTKIYSWATGGALEVYNLSSCSQLPSQPAVWKNLRVYADSGLTQITPAWNAAYLGNGPSCTYNVASTATSVTLTGY